jgi:N-ethylmaleimide reductase
VFTPTGPRPAPTPRALEEAEIPEHTASYADAARRPVESGGDGVELHGANGYMISQFLSSNANLRTDSYGGPVAHRIRFAVEAVAATVDAVGRDRTGIRLSPGGTFWGVEENEVRELYTALLTELARIGPAYVHLEATTDEELLLELRRVWPGTLIMNPVLPMGPKQVGRDEPTTGSGRAPTSSASAAPTSPTPTWSSGSVPVCRSPRWTRTRTTRVETGAT